MIVEDSYLIFIASKDSNYIHIYDKMTLNPLFSFGKRGNAGFEFSRTPMFLKNSHGVNADFLEVFDIHSMKKINIINILNGDNVAKQITSKTLDEELKFSREIARLNNNNIVGTSLNLTEGLFFIYNEAKKNGEWIPYNPKINVSERYYNHLYNGSIEVNLEKQIIVFTLRFFDRVLFYNHQGELMKTLNFSDIEIPQLNEEYSGVSHDATIYSLKTYSTENYIYILRPITSLNNLTDDNSSLIKAQVLCLTWSGEVEATYCIDFNTMPTLFCVDEPNKRILFNTPVDSYLSKDGITEISVYAF